MNEEIETAKDQRGLWERRFQYSQERKNESSDDFTKLVIHIATILFTLSGVFAISFLENVPLYLKLVFSLGLLFTFTSLGFGLLHLTKKGDFWDEVTDVNHEGFLRWNEASKGKITNKEALKFCDGMVKSKKTNSPMWTWQAQIRMLVVGSILLLLSFLLKIFI